MNIQLHHIANLYRTYDATVTMVLCKIPEQHADIPVPGPKTKPRSGNRYFIWQYLIKGNLTQERLCYHFSKEEYFWKQRVVSLHSELLLRWGLLMKEIRTACMGTTWKGNTFKRKALLSEGVAFYVPGDKFFPYWITSLGSERKKWSL